MTYLVKIEDTEKHGAWYSGDQLETAVWEAMDGSRTHTMQAFAIGIIALAIANETFPSPEAGHLRAFLRAITVPVNMRNLVNVALDEADD